MIISFFEEFPTRNNLEKASLIAWPTKLYIAAKSVREFDQVRDEIKNKIRNRNVKECVYWPILEIDEGYWISPFARRSALKRVFHGLEGNKIPVMLDLELPTTKNPKLYLTQFFSFLKNRSLIKNFLDNYPGKVYLAEYYPEGKGKEKILQALGLHYKTNNAKIIKMIYHSLHRFDKEFITRELKSGKEEFGNNYLIAYGTIAQGIAGREPILSLSQLEEDLRIAKDLGISEVIIYRLGGLNDKYLKILSKYA